MTVQDRVEFIRSIRGFRWVPGWRLFGGACEADLCVDLDALVLKSSIPSAHYCQVLGGTGLALDEPVVLWRVWVSLVKLSELLQTAYRKVVEWFFRPVFVFQIVVSFDQV